MKYGATHNTTPGESFGEITDIFEVEDDWTGYQFHGYCIPTEREVAEFFKVQEAA